jgi:hypothetical protein
MSDSRGDTELEVPSDHPFREMVNDHPLAAVATAFFIGLLLAKLAF